MFNLCFAEAQKLNLLLYICCYIGVENKNQSNFRFALAKRSSLVRKTEKEDIKQIELQFSIKAISEKLMFVY